MTESVLFASNKLLCALYQTRCALPAAPTRGMGRCDSRCLFRWKPSMSEGVVWDESLEETPRRSKREGPVLQFAEVTGEFATVSKLLIHKSCVSTVKHKRSVRRACLPILSVSRSSSFKTRCGCPLCKTHKFAGPLPQPLTRYQSNYPVTPRIRTAW